MDEATIRREASEALRDLELDSTASAITQSGKNWCIQFSGDYGQFCDSFQNQFEHDNSPRVIREKIKKHLLGQITQLRNKGNLKTRRKGSDEAEGRGRNVTELFQEAITQTTRAVTEAIDRTLGVTEATIKSAGDAAETLSASTAAILRPERTGKPPAAKRAARKSSSGKETGKVKRSGTKKKASGKTKRAGRAKKSAGKKSSRK
jgi:hypothetical protein